MRVWGGVICGDVLLYSGSQPFNPSIEISHSDLPEICSLLSLLPLTVRVSVEGGREEGAEEREEECAVSMAEWERELLEDGRHES